MARIRTVKPDLFRHEELFESEQSLGLPLRLVFIGLFCCCDRAGRFEWRPRKLKLDVLPYDDIDFSRVLDALATCGFVVKYEVSGVIYGCIPSFSNHQVINNREKQSELPEISAGKVLLGPLLREPCENNGVVTRDSRVSDTSATRHGNAQEEGKGREGERKGITACAAAENLSASNSPDSKAPATKSIGLPLLGELVYVVDADQLKRLAELFPDLDVEQEVRSMIGWFDCHPEKLRPRTQIRQFINSWLTNRQADYHHKHSAGGHAGGNDDDPLGLNDTSWADDLVIPDREVCA
jgi:hypothetical protein